MHAERNEMTGMDAEGLRIQPLENGKTICHLCTEELLPKNMAGHLKRNHRVDLVHTRKNERY